MVNAEKVLRKLPSLLVDDCSNRKKKGWNKFMRTRRRVSKFKADNPERFNTLTNNLIADLTELEKAVSNGS
jgi:hypothetical protein